MSIKKFFESFVQKNFTGDLKESSDLDDLFNQYITEKMATLLVEDHSENMTVKEMTKHIRKLFKMCDDEKTEKKFLKHLGSAVGIDKCEERDIKKCSEKICKMGAGKCDDIIHELEDIVGYEYDYDNEEEDDDKKKLDEGVDVGSVIKTLKGTKMVVLGKLIDGDVTAAPLHHGKPMYRSQVNLRSDEYIPTGETMKVMSKKEWDARQRDIMADRSEYYDVSYSLPKEFDF